MPTTIFAQDKELINLTYGYSKLKTSDTTKTVRTFEGNIALPIFYNDRNVLSAVIGYRQVGLSNLDINYPETVYGTSVRLMYQTRLSEKHQLRLIGQMGAFGDYQNFSSSSFRWTIGSEYIIQGEGNSKFGYGLVYSHQFYGHQIVPLFEMFKQLNERWSIAGIFPVNPKIVYKINEKSRTGFEWNVDVNTYRIASEESQNRYFKSTQSTFSLFYRYTIAKHWNINFKAGISPRQEFGIYDENEKSTWYLVTIPLGKKIQPVESFKNSSFTGQIGISYSLF